MHASKHVHLSFCPFLSVPTYLPTYLPVICLFIYLSMVIAVAATRAMVLMGKQGQ